MAPPAGVLVAAGLLLIAISLADIGLTVLHVQAESPISTRVQRFVWGSVVLVSRLSRGAVRDRILALGMPLMMVATIGFWVSLHLVGFALVYLPFIRDPAWFAHQTIERSSAPLVALYFSTVSFVTVGYGDVVPIHPVMRLLAVTEGLFGLLVVSFSVTYLLSVYPLVTRKVALAVALNQELAGRADGAAVAVRYVRADRFDAFAERLRALHDELLVISHAHSVYPLLFFVRPAAVQESFVRALASIQGLVCTLRYLLDPDRYSSVVTDPRLAVLEEGLLYTLHTLDRSSRLIDPERKYDHQGAHIRITRTVEALADAGLTPVSLDDPAVHERLLRFAAATDPFIHSYATRLHYDADRVWGTYGRWARDTALEAAPGLHSGEPEPTSYSSDSPGSISSHRPRSSPSRIIR